MTDREAALRAWSECTVLLQAMIQPEVYNAWFPHIKPVSLIGVEMTLGVPSQFFCEYIETHFINELKQVLQRVIGPNVVLKYKALVDDAELCKQCLWCCWCLYDQCQRSCRRTEGRATPATRL